MATTVQARLDKATEAALKRLIRSEGWTPSEAIRECIRESDERRSIPVVRKLIGVGMFDSGITDLASNKAHMKDYGVKSMGKGWRRPEERSRKAKAK